MFKLLLHGHQKVLFMDIASSRFVFYQVMASKYPTYTFPMLMPPALLLAPYAIKRERVVRNTVILISLLFITGLFICIAPLTHRYSAEDQVPLLQSLTTEDTLILSYGMRYPASIVYYSGHRVERLETKLKDLKA